MKWNIFKRNEKEITWMDVSYKKFKKLEEFKQEGKITMDDIARVIYGDDVDDLPIGEYNKKIRLLRPLTEPIAHELKVKKVKVNDRIYEFKGLLGDITAAQYIDYNNWLNRKEELKSFSVFFVPEGHKYNDGYDMEQVFKDLEEVPAPILNSASFFFMKQLALFIKTFRRSLLKMMKDKKLPKEIKKQTMETLTNLNNLVLSHLS